MVSQDEIKTLAEDIAQKLGETETVPLRQIKQIVEVCGADFAQAILEETLKVEAEGGMLVSTGERRRTVGGIFFYLARGRMTGAQRYKIFISPMKKQRDVNKTPPTPRLNWDNRQEALQSLLEEMKGSASNVKITLMGRPGKLETRKDLVITMMEHVLNMHSMPKGVPRPEGMKTLYTVYISARQWRKVEEAIADPEDILIIEGICGFDPKINGVAVFAKNVTTRAMQRAKRDATASDGDDTQQEDASEPKPEQPKTRARKTLDIPEPAASPVEADIPSGAPPEVAQKLRELHTAAATFRQKLAALESKPEGQRFGLEMTQKLLKNTEDQIAALEAKYK